MVLMKERFINPEEFYFFGGDKKLLCCSITIELLESALDNFNDSLQVSENLMGYWLNDISNPIKELSSSEKAITLELLYLLNSHDMESYLSMND
jgi:hypothetical protein